MVGAGEIEPELGGDDELLSERSEGLADQLLVGKRPVHLGRIEERDAALHRRPKQRGHLPLVLWRAVGKAHAHAAEAQGGDFQAALSKFAFLHRCSFT